MAWGPRRVSDTPRPAEKGGPHQREEALLDLLDDETVLFLLRFGIRLGVGIFGVSERTLRRRFERFGIPLSGLLGERRRQEALRLLAGDAPLKTVALHLGFSSTQTLARYLRREFGTTATVLRKQLRSGENGFR
ncbi:MAG: helix-turn-helix domain-containing protein [Acidithiobacillales bacterium]